MKLQIVRKLRIIEKSFLFQHRIEVQLRGSKKCISGTLFIACFQKRISQCNHCALEIRIWLFEFLQFLNGFLIVTQFIIDVSYLVAILVILGFSLILALEADRKSTRLNSSHVKIS